MIYIIPIVSASSYHRGQVDFGTLEQLGFLSKRYVNTGEPDQHDIEWTVIGPIEFDDSLGNHWQYRDVITWSK